MIMVIGEQRDGHLHPATAEAIAAARELASGDPIMAVLPSGVRTPALDELAVSGVKQVLAVLHEALEPYTADGFVMALQDVVKSMAPR